MAIVDTLAIRFESEAGKALKNVEGLDKSLSKLATIVGKLSGAKINLGINDQSAKNLTDFGKAVNKLDLAKLIEFGKAMKKIPEVKIGVKADTGSNLTAFSKALQTFDFTKAEMFGEITQKIKGINLGSISEKGALNLRSFNAALAGFDIYKFSLFSEIARGMPEIKISISSTTGTAMQEFAKGIGMIDVAKFSAFRNIAEGFKGFSLGLGQKSVWAFKDFGTALNQINLSAFREFANIVSFDLKPVKTGLTLNTAKNIAYFGAAINSLDMTKLHGFADALERIGNAAEKIRGVTGAMRSLNRGFEQMDENSKKATKSAGHTANILTKLADKIKGVVRSIGRIAFYRAIRSAIKAVTQGFSEGIKNLYHWSQLYNTSFAPKMDQLATATKYLRNGFASMFSPLIEWGVPILDKMIDRFVDFFNFVQEGFARLTGAPTWNRALKKAVKYEQDATKEAKKLQAQLMGFDELNVLNTDQGSNGTSNIEDYSGLFELVQTGAGEGFAQRLANAINSVFEDPEKFKTYGENLADWIMDGFDNTIEFVVSLNTENIGASVANFVSGFNTELAKRIAEEDFGEAQVKLAEKLAGLIDGLLTKGTNGKIMILDSLKKLIGSIFASIPSLILGAFQSLMITLRPILQALGLNKFAEKLMEIGEKFGAARKAYESSKGTALSSLFQYIDSGNWEPLTTRGFDYDPTQDNGRSFDENGAVLSSGSIFSMLSSGVFDSKDMEGFKFIKTIIDEFKQFYENNRGTLDTLFENIALTAQALAPLIAAIAKIVGTQMITEFTMMTTAFLETLTPALNALNGVLGVFNGILEMLFGDKAKGMEEFVEGIEKIGSALLRVLLSPMIILLKVMAAIYDAFAAFLPEGKFRDWFVSAGNSVRGAAKYLGELPELLTKTPEEQEARRKEYEKQLVADQKAMKEGLGEGEAPVKSGIERVFDWFSNLRENFFSGLKDSFYIDPDTGGSSSSTNTAYEAALPFKLKTPTEKDTTSTLNKFWTSVKSIWGKDRWVGTKNKITEITKSVREGWSTFKEKWGDKFANTKSRIIGITSGIKTGWETFKEKWGEKRYANSPTLITGITAGIKDGWETFKGIWNDTDRSAEVTATLGTNWITTTNFLTGYWRGIQKDWGTKELGVELTADGINVKNATFYDNAPQSPLGNGYLKLPVRWKASGGFLNPNSYSLYGLGENGIPEILGTVGGRSAVAGGAEITGIREAIYEQGQREENLLRSLISAVNSKDLTLVANSSTGRWVNRALNAYAGVTG